MKRDVFNSICNFEVGKIFLLNLLESIKLGLIDDESYSVFICELEKISDRSVIGWWNYPFRNRFLASKTPRFKTKINFSSVVAFNKERLSGINPLLEIFGEDPEPKSVHENDFVRIFFSSLSSKKIYWLTDKRSLNYSYSADCIRDKLGLDWINEGMYLYRIDLCYEKVVSKIARRPSALCGGTPRFRVRRFDESKHRYFEGWGRTVDLLAWRSRRKGARLMGAPEVISYLGPLNEVDSEICFVGKTLFASGCRGEEDDCAFATSLNGDKIVDPDSLYSEITESIGRLCDDRAK